ncbi:MAG: hypothetical protein U0229_22530 [Anaeromyxobacter sp.]
MKPITRTLLAAAALAGAAALPMPARAQVGVSITLGLPVSPGFVVVSPGVQVLPDYDEEVFLVGGVYWLRRGPSWYRAPGPRAAFVYVPPPRVPARLVRLPPPGHYRRWRPEPVRAERGEWREGRREDREERGPGRGHAYGHEKRRGRGHDRD